MVRAAFEAWAELLQYPAGRDLDRLRSRVDLIVEEAPELRDTLEPLLDYAREQGEAELEEVFTRTFDSNAERALEVGWHLHGENYARGAFMVRMRALLRELEVHENGELPDHVSHVLRVLAKADEGTARALARGVLSPALAKIEEGFTNRENPYFGVVHGLKRFLEESLLRREATPA